MLGKDQRGTRILMQGLIIQVSTYNHETTRTRRNLGVQLIQQEAIQYTGE